MRILFLAPHLSTGGMPAFLLRRIQELKAYDNSNEIFVAEWTNYSDTFTVQKNKIKELVGESNYICLGQLDEESETHFNNRIKLLDKCYEWSIDIIHIDEIPEGFDSFSPFPLELQKHLYDSNHPWRIVETCHNIWFEPNKMKKVQPDGFALVSPEHETRFKDLKVVKDLITFPHSLAPDVILRDREEILGNFGFRTTGEFHICTIGLWTPGKNQGYVIELARELYNKYGHTYQFHFVGNQAPNFAEYWQPLMNDLPPNCKIWGEREDTHNFLNMSDVMLFASTWECNPIVLAEAAAFNTKTMAYNLPQYGNQWTNKITHITGKVKEDAEALIKLCWNKKPRRFEIDGGALFAQKHIELYKNVAKRPTQRGALPEYVDQDYKIEVIDGIKFYNRSTQDCIVTFTDAKTGKEVYTTDLKPGFWASPVPTYFVNWQLDWTFKDGTTGTWKLDLNNKVANLWFGSSSLGDSLAFMEAVVAFKNAHNLAKVNLLTFKNWLFDWDYYNSLGIYSIQPNSKWPDAEIRFELGVHIKEVGEGEPWQPNRNPRDWRKIYLGDVASDILGLESIGEVRPKLAFKDLGRPTTNKYIVIATQSTAQAKYWNNPTGWQDLVDWHIKNGYSVYIASSEGDGYMGNFYPKGAHRLPSGLEEVANWIRHSEYFIGISSGLSWLAWSVDVPVVLISGFTPEICEFTDKTLRIINKSVCNSCWEWDHFDKNNWHWCPAHAGTKRQFECTKTITAIDVINKIQTWTK